MRKLLATTGVLLSTLTLVTPAFAQGDSSASASVTAGTATSAQLACMSAAISARETATIDARTTYHASVSAAMTTRKAALLDAYAIADNEDRAAAVTAAWTAYFNATMTAHTTYKASIKSATEAFVTAKADCGIDSDDVLVHHPKHHDDDENDDNNGHHGHRGLHLGWFKHGHR